MISLFSSGFDLKTVKNLLFNIFKLVEIKQLFKNVGAFKHKMQKDDHFAEDFGNMRLVFNVEVKMSIFFFVLFI